MTATPLTCGPVIQYSAARFEVAAFDFLAKEYADSWLCVTKPVVVLNVGTFPHLG